MRTLRCSVSILIFLFLSGSVNAGVTSKFEVVSHANSVTKDSVVYSSKRLVIRQLAPHVFVHVSYLQTKDFGNVECNGMLLLNGKDAIVFDTPADDTSSQELISYVLGLKYKIKAVIATHFHADCVGGLNAFSEHSIKGYASFKTIEFLKGVGNDRYTLLEGFHDSLKMVIGNKHVYVKYFGEGHTRDNVVGYFPEEKALFGGCLIKETGASKGNLADANVSAWTQTVTNVKTAFPQAVIVIPGHGKVGGTELLDYTIKLFQ